MAIVRPDNCHPFLSAFLDRRKDRGRICMEAGCGPHRVLLIDLQPAWPTWRDAAFACIVIFGALFLATVPLP